MWEPRRLTTLWASIACYRESFTLTFYFISREIQFSACQEELYSEGHTNNVCVFKNPQISTISNHDEKQKYFLNFQCRFVCTGTLLDYYLRFFVISTLPLCSYLCQCLVFNPFHLFFLSLYSFTLYLFESLTK
jgi:hypothetical protein